MEQTDGSDQTLEQSHESTQERAAERDEIGKTDAPTSGEENEGYSTVLSAEPLTGVQDNDGEE